MKNHISAAIFILSAVTAIVFFPAMATVAVEETQNETIIENTIQAAEEEQNTESTVESLIESGSSVPGIDDNIVLDEEKLEELNNQARELSAGDYELTDEAKEYLGIDGDIDIIATDSEATSSEPSVFDEIKESKVFKGSVTALLIAMVAAIFAAI